MPGTNALITTHAHVVDAPELEDRITTDPDDDCLFACAVAASCRSIVSGDRRAPAASGHRGIQVIKPRQLVDALG